MFSHRHCWRGVRSDRRLDYQLSVVDDVRRHGHWVDARRQLELVVELTACSTSAWTGLITLCRHYQPPVNRLYAQFIGAELCTQRHRHAEPARTRYALQFITESMSKSAYQFR